MKFTSKSTICGAWISLLKLIVNASSFFLSQIIKFTTKETNKFKKKIDSESVNDSFLIGPNSVETMI